VIAASIWSDVDIDRFITSLAYESACRISAMRPWRRAIVVATTIGAAMAASATRTAMAIARRRVTTGDDG